MSTAVPVRVEVLRGTPDGDHILLDLPAEDIPTGTVYDQVVPVAPGLSFLVVSNDTAGTQVPVEWIEGTDPPPTDKFIATPAGQVAAQPGQILNGFLYNLPSGNVLLIELLQ